MIVIINLLIFLLLIKEGINKTDFDRLPTPPVNYRYFVELDQTYKILGSCTEVKTTTPMSRCIIKIVHKYKPRYLSIQFAEELIGTGIIIHKSTDGAPYLVILTAFHIVVPQLDLNLLTFMLYIFITISVGIIPIIIYYSSVVYQHLCKFLFGLISYVIICSCLVYYVLIVTYPFLFDSSFQITLLSNNKNSIRSETSQVNCELISSNFVLSFTWWDDIGK